MAFVKVKVDALEQQKKEYEKAIKSLDGALEQIKKVNASLGTDAMLEGVRTSLTKLAVSLETRQGTLLVMIKALEQSGTKYRTAQKKAVTRSNQFRAHHRDFYGNPVVVTVVAGGAGAMAGAAADAGVRPAVYTERGTSTTVSQVSERARNTAAGVPSSNRSETTAGPPVTASTESIGASDQPVSTEPVPDALGTENDSDPDFGSYIGTAGAAAAGAVIGAAAGSVLGTLAGKHPQISGKAAEHKTMKPAAKEKKQEPSTDIEAQLEAARERLRRFNEMEMKEKKMRKRMSRMKKEMAVAVAAAMCISLVGCGGGSSKKVVADKKEAVETTVAETTETETTAEKLTGVNDSEMADILAGTTWAGISSTQEIMVAAFDEKDAYLAILDTDGEVTDLDGYWKADTDTFYLYLNEDYSDDPTTFAFDWYNTENGEYIQLDDIVLSSEGDGSNLETTLDQMMTTASVIEYVAQGTYWIGSGDETAMIFYFEDDQAYFDLLYNDNGQIQTQSISGIWSLDYDHLNLIDDETGVSYELGWDLSEEGDSYCFELTEDDTTYYLYESAAEDVDSTLDILTSYLTAEDSVDVESDDIDLSDFLEGYEGHSVIDAFMLSGISPDFETRKYCAELLGFVNYSGTSDENLALIQLMGGTVQ